MNDDIGSVPGALPTSFPGVDQGKSWERKHFEAVPSGATNGLCKIGNGNVSIDFVRPVVTVVLLGCCR